MKRLLALFTAFLLFGCGQSGPLYIPGDPSRIENPPPPPAEESPDEESASEDGDTDRG